MNSVVATVLYLLQALRRRIIVYCILSKIKRIRANLATAMYDNKQSDYWKMPLLDKVPGGKMSAVNG